MPPLHNAKCSARIPPGRLSLRIRRRHRGLRENLFGPPQLRHVRLPARPDGRGRRGQRLLGIQPRLPGRQRCRRHPGQGVQLPPEPPLGIAARRRRADGQRREHPGTLPANRPRRLPGGPHEQYAGGTLPRHQRDRRPVLHPAGIQRHDNLFLRPRSVDRYPRPPAKHHRPLRQPADLFLDANGYARPATERDRFLRPHRQLQLLRSRVRLPPRPDHRLPRPPPRFPVRSVRAPGSRGHALDPEGGRGQHVPRRHGLRVPIRRE